MTDPGDSRTSPSLLGRLQRQPGDPEAWSLFVRRYGRMIYRWCRCWHLQDADAQDVTQNVLTRLAARMRTFTYDPARSFRAWLKTVTQHAWQDFLESRKPHLTGTGDDGVLSALHNLEAGDDLVRRLEQTWEAELLEAAMARVRLRVIPRTWEAFRLTALEGLSGTEAGERLGMTAPAVLMAKSNVLRMLREEVRRLEGDESW